MNPEQWLSLKWNGGSTMSDRWLNQSKIIQILKSWLQEKRNCDFCSWPTVDFEYMIKNK